MATTKSQRWGILAILIVTVIGTIGSFAVIVLSTQNQAKDTVAQQKAYAEYKQKSDEYEKKVAAQADALSAQYYDTFKPYEDRVAAFDLAGV